MVANEQAYQLEQSLMVIHELIQVVPHSFVLCVSVTLPLCLHFSKVAAGQVFYPLYPILKYEPFLTASIKINRLAKVHKLMIS